MEIHEYREILKRFSSHRLDVPKEAVIDSWVIGIRNGDLPPQDDATQVTVYLSFFDKMNKRRVRWFTITVRELMAGLEGFSKVNS